MKMQERLETLGLPIKRGTERRKGLPKSRRGCITCKVRRVKCDERQPGCLRCEKFGRKCEGYLKEGRQKNIVQPISTRKLAPKPQIHGRSTAIVIPKITSASAQIKVWKDGHTSLQPRHSAAQTPALIQHPSSKIFDNNQQYNHFRFFCERSAYQLSGCFDSIFWHRLVLQASEREPSIRHAVIAIGALTPISYDGAYSSQVKFERPAMTGLSTESQLLQRQRHEKQQYALKEYSRAITMMRKALHDGNHDIRMMLIACLIFTCFETMHSNNESALAQIYSGLKMIDNWYAANKTDVNATCSFGIRSPRPDIVEDELVQAFNRMDVQAMVAVDRRTEEYHNAMQRCGQSSIDLMQSVFPNLKEARVHIELIMRRHLHFEAATMQYCHRYRTHTPAGISSYGGPQRQVILLSVLNANSRENLGETSGTGVNQREACIPKSAYDDCARHLADLEQWHKCFEPLLQHSRTPEGKEDFLIATTLQVHYLASKVSLASALFTSQMLYDIYTPEYQELNELVKQLLKHPQYSSKNGLFTFDFQIVVPLYACAIKCRDRQIRRDAINLLITSSRHEGVWDGILAGRVLQWVMRIEEEGIDDDIIIPEDSRVQGVRVDIDREAKLVRVRCLKPKKGCLGQFDLLEASEPLGDSRTSAEPFLNGTKSIPSAQVADLEARPRVTVFATNL